MPKKYAAKIDLKFFVEDRGSKSLHQRLEVTCPNKDCGHTFQLVVWKEYAYESIRALMCPDCGKALYTVEEFDDENGGVSAPEVVKAQEVKAEEKKDVGSSA